jgi:hypothetical protein
MNCLYVLPLRQSICFVTSRSGTYIYKYNLFLFRGTVRITKTVTIIKSKKIKTAKFSGVITLYVVFLHNCNL